MYKIAEDRFQREILLIGQGGYERLRDSHVAVFGIGGVGSFCAEAMAEKESHSLRQTSIKKSTAKRYMCRESLKILLCCLIFTEYKE